MSRFIVIEGLIGVGKTTLCQILAQQWKASLVLEPCDDNPFLAAFYRERDRYAFPAQMFYLATRYSQQMQLRQPELFSDLVVSDYLFAKDRLFAEQTLRGNELDLYDRFAGLLDGTIPSPEFVIFLDAPTEVVTRRISRRAIDAEEAIDPSYLDELRARYLSLWSRYNAAPVYVVNTSEINYVDDLADRERMLTMIAGWLNGRPVAGAPAPYGSEVESQIALFPRA